MLGIMFEPFFWIFLNLFILYNDTLPSWCWVGNSASSTALSVPTEAHVARMHLFLKSCPALDLPMLETNKFSIGLFFFFFV